MGQYTDAAKRVFQRAITLDGEERNDYVRQACADDQGLRREVDTLLEVFVAGERPAGVFSGESEPDAAWWRDQALDEPPLPDPMLGRSIGRYRILKVIGTGGMGSVYLAEPEGEPGRLVAIKTLRAGMDDDNVLRRFQIERRTLGAMQHPNIVALLDSGTNEDGRPFFVMEYVEGEPIDEYCDRQALAIDTRLKLFRDVCGAVHYAHQHLVVHRDLKPPNIRVTPEGVPKLLDFGIAKIFDAGLTPGQTNLTRTGVAPMTPDYASPEQVMGQTITTATDVYALGVLLYRLLTGRPPYELTTGAAAELYTMIVENDPPRPSQAALAAGQPALWRRLRGDLDMIVMMALRKEPELRYASVEQFSEDIRRHLDGWTVIARRGTTGYRLSRFIRRHKAAVTATALVAVSLIAATIISVIERRHAERRFEETRSLARFVLFEFDDAIRTGVTPARKKLVTEALTYLDRLSQEAGRDVSLLREVMEGYFKVGDVQGNPYGPNLGDMDGARESYRRALALAELIGAGSLDARARADLSRARIKFGDLLALGGNRQAALAEYGKSRAALEQAVAEQPTVDNKRALLAAVDKIGFTQYQVGDFAGAVESYTRCVRLATEIHAAGPNTPGVWRAVAAGHERLGELLARSHKTEEGLENLRSALRTYEELAAASPEDPAAQRDVSNTHTIIGDILFAAVRTEEALASYRRGLAIAEKLARDDPQNRQARTDLHLALGRLADICAAVGRREESRAMTQRALAVLRSIVDRPDASQYDVQNYAWILVTTPFEDLRRPVEAEKYAAKAVAMTDSSDPRMLDLQARALEGAGKLPQAVEVEQKALAMLPPSGQSDLRKELEGNLARFREKLARLPR